MGVPLTTGRRGLCAPGEPVRHVRPASRVLVQPGARRESEDEGDGKSDPEPVQKTTLAALSSLAGGRQAGRQLVRRRSGPRALGPQEKQMFIRARRFVVRSRLTGIQEGRSAQGVCVCVCVGGGSVGRW